MQVKVYNKFLSKDRESHGFYLTTSYFDTKLRRIINFLSLKLVSTIFYPAFIFSPNDSPSKTMKSVFYFI